MRTFWLQRDEDVSGVSGVGLVAEGVQWLDGQVALHWLAGLASRGVQSTIVYGSIEAVRTIHGHDGKTRIVWEDEDSPPERVQEAPG